MGTKIMLSVVAGIAAGVWVWGYGHFSDPEPRAMFLLFSILAAGTSGARSKSARGG